MMLIIFDVDGTLIGGETADWECFYEAFLAATGVSLTEQFWSNISEVTAQAIVHQALPEHSFEARLAIERSVCRNFLDRLKRFHAANRTAFSPLPGAAELLDYLNQHADFRVAIATGDWRETTTFKLRAAGIEVSDYPMATSSDRYARADIIRLAAVRAGVSLNHAVYVGDGLWDFRASQFLGIPFVGVGHRGPKLLEAGAIHVLEALGRDGFFARIRKIREEQRAEHLNDAN